MKRKSEPSRREFIEGAIAAGAAFAIGGLSRGVEPVGGGDDGKGHIPLETEEIDQPDEPICAWVGFSPVNDQVAFVAGTPGETSLYVSRPGKAHSFDVLWEPEFNLSVIRSCAWSPDGREIAFLVQGAAEKKNSKSWRISLFVADAAMKTVREPVIIAESNEGSGRRVRDASYKKNISWLNDSSVCIPAEKGAGLMKLDTHTGQVDTLDGQFKGLPVSNVALTRNGELRFIQVRNMDEEKDRSFLLGGIRKDGMIADYGDLAGRLGGIYNARLSQDGEYIFAEKQEETPKLLPMLAPRNNLIYRIDMHSVIGQIPVTISTRDDIYYYLPMAVRNGNELIVIEMVSMAVDGTLTERNHRAKAVKVMLQ